MSTVNDTEQVLTIPITQPDAVVTLHDRIYASMNMSTDSPSRSTHRVAITLGDGDLNLHFDGVYLVMSPTDWERVAQGVAEVLAASAVSA